MSRRLLLCIALLASVPTAAAADAGTATPAERGQWTREFVLKWGPYLQMKGMDVRTWSRRMVPTFVAADPGNFRRALSRDTLEGALAELNGRGQRLADGQVIDALAATGLSERPDLMAQAAKTLGSTTNDLVFTSVTPCRVLDTRIAGGAVTAGSSRSFIVVAVSAGSGFAFQGGSSTDCNVAAVGASAVVLNVTAVQPSNVGFTTVYKHGETRPTAAAITYNAGQLISNTVVVGIPNPLGINDVTLYSSAQAHYVADIVGYFSPPQATRLQCSDTAISTFTVAANTSTFINNPACPTGYDAITPYCYTNASGVFSRGSGYNSNTSGLATFCAWQNTTGTTQQVFGGNVCCRIPGR